MFNLSSLSLDKTTSDLLDKGLNVAISPHHLPFEDILCNIENSLRCLPPHEAKEIRQDCSKILRHAKPPKPNLSKLEFLALKNIKFGHSRHNKYMLCLFFVSNQTCHLTCFFGLHSKVSLNTG